MDGSHHEEEEMARNNFFAVAKQAGLRTQQPIFKGDNTFGCGPQIGTRDLTEQEIVRDAQIQAKTDPSAAAFLAAYYTTQFQR